MAELPIVTHKLDRKPGQDAYRWRVWLAEDVPLCVELSRTAAMQTGLGATELTARLPHALQRFAAERLDNDVPVLDQVLNWNQPVVLRPDHFA